MFNLSKKVHTAGRSIRPTFLALCAVSALLLSFPGLCQGEVVRKSNLVRNGSFNKRGAKPPYSTQEKVEKRRKDGWKCPDVAEWPLWWGVYGNKPGTVEFPRTNGVLADGYARLGGEGVYLTGYHGHPLENCNYVYTIWARGKGRLRFHVLSYGRTKTGKTRRLTKKGEAATGKSVPVDSKAWVRYRHLLVKSPALWSVMPWVGVEDGVLDIDDVDIVPSTPALDLIVAAESALYGSGALIEDLDVVQADEVFAGKVKSYKEAVAAFKQAKTTIGKDLGTSLEQEMSTLAPYVLTGNLSAVQAVHYNDMIVLTRVLNTLAGKEPTKPTTVQAQSAVAINAVAYKPGERAARPKTVTITDIRSNKVRYDENETATTKVTVVNRDDAKHAGNLIAVMRLDLDTEREIGRTDFAIAPGQTKGWSLSYSVGPETYGRGIEVRFVDQAGTVADSWREFYAVAAEWFRVQQHTYGGQMKNYKVDPWVTYFNQKHYFASEPTAFGVRLTDVEKYISPQVGYHINIPTRSAQMAHSKKRGINNTFYQINAFCGQMGYEEVRQHPEYVLYDANGQFAVDPVYGGHPNPLEIASPIEIGEDRKVEKPYLDRMITPWQHVCANLAREEVVVYEANCVKEYAGELGFDGVYFDGNLGILKGCGYDGKPNVPADRAEDYARLNARNHRIWSEILKKDNPNFGTWYNWHYPTEAQLLWAESKGRKTYYGSGYKGDVSDESIRAAAGWKNVMFLNEQQIHSFTRGPLAYPEKLLDALADNRDYIVQRYGANHIIGYFFLPIPRDDPGLSKWAWPTVNYMGAQFIAAQVHFATGFMPSWRPTLQFMTRYSRFIWAPDVKVVPEAEKFVRVSAAEEVLWKPLVYRLKTREDDLLIMHLVCTPPTKKWDFNWVDEPVPLEGVEITVDLEKGKLQSALAMRPYYFEEEQQPVRTILEPRTSGEEVTVMVPPFRYHTMVVLRVAESGETAGTIQP